MPTMTALSIQEPWISMIIRGEKTLEVRSRRTRFRGLVLLCSSKKVYQADLLNYSPDKRKIGPLGHAVAIGQLVDCRPMNLSDTKAACCRWTSAYVWILESVRPLAKPFPVKGQRGLFKVEVPEGAL